MGNLPIAMYVRISRNSENIQYNGLTERIEIIYKTKLKILFTKLDRSIYLHFD